MQAIRSCFLILSECGDMHRGSVKPLEVDNDVSLLCRELGDFVTSTDMFPDPGRRASVVHHVGAVQRAVMESSQKLLAEGKAGIPDLVRTIGTLLDSLVEQRWLNLLDIPGAPASYSVTRSPQNEPNRRDAWIVIGGSVAAAVGLGVAATVGVPLGAAIPAALVFLLGPATLWGSRRLGMSPQRLLESVRTPITEASQGGGAPPRQGSAQGQEQTSGQGGSSV
ncbi:hypothetical protein [Streptomyces spiralis]|uniref:hypothetical protein n=1 Tax=Streptomyces spiralis TaxID=66376 RepID=UPI0033E5F3F6